MNIENGDITSKYRPPNPKSTESKRGKPAILAEPILPLTRENGSIAYWWDEISTPEVPSDQISKEI